MAKNSQLLFVMLVMTGAVVGFSNILHSSFDYSMQTAADGDPLALFADALRNAQQSGRL